MDFRIPASALVFLAVASQVSAQTGKRVDQLEEADRLAVQPIPLAQVMIDLKPGVNPTSFAALNGMRILRPMRSMDNGWVMETSTASMAARLTNTLKSSHLVEWIQQDRRIFMERMQFVPNDPFYNFNNPAGYSGQWHLRNTNNIAGNNIDSRVWPAWQRNITGAGVIVGIVDDSVEIGHPDLAPNALLSESWDFGANDNDPSPINANERHGTSVAGVSAARGGNGLGVTGAAPFANIAGFRVDFPNQTESMFIDATLYRSSGTTTTIKVKNHSYGYSAAYVNTPNSSAAFVTSAAAGTVHLVAAGNNRGGVAQDTGRMDMQSEPSVITVAALGQNGRFASYSNFGAAVAVTAPSNSSGFNAITTTDRVGAAGYNGMPDTNYTNGFGGTSSATPLAAGIMALVKEVQPALNVRFAKHLLSFCSDRVDLTDTSATSDGGWRQNAAGIWFNQNYGFGLINADKLTTNAPLFSGVTPQGVENIPSTSVGIAIPDNNATGITQTFVSTSTGRMEEFILRFTATHPFRGDLAIWVTSPSGTTGRLTGTSGDSGANLSNWRFSSNLFWGENPAGTWTIRVADIGASDLGTWTSYSAQIRTGELILASNSVATVTTTPSSVGGGQNSLGSITLQRALPINHPGLTVTLASSSPLASVPATVTIPAGASSVTFPITTLSTTTDTSVSISAAALSGTVSGSLVVQKLAISGVSMSPTLVKGGTNSTGTVTLNTFAPAGGLVVTLTSNRPSVTVPATITIPAGSLSGTFTATTSGVTTQTAATIVARATGIPSRFAVLTVDPPLLTGYSLSPTTVVGSSATTGTVTLDSAAGAGGFVVNLTSNRASVTVPATVTVAEGSTTATFSVNTTAVSSLVQATLYAQAGFRSRFAVLSVNPPGLSTHTVNPSTVSGGASAVGTITIESPAPVGGLTISLTSNRASVTVPGTVTIPEGQTSADYTVTTTSSAALVQATLVASFNGRSRWTVLNVNPPALLSHTLSPSTVSGGTESTGTVTLDSPAPAGGLVVSLTSNRASVTVPVSVTVPAGATSVTYQVTTTTVTAAVQATLVASANGRTRWVVLTVNP